MIVPKFDVFMCYNSKNKPEVIKIAYKLKETGLNPWLDDWEIEPGTPWKRSFEKGISQVRSAAIFVGSDGIISSWQDQEISILFNQFMRRKISIIPVVLASLPMETDVRTVLPLFLQSLIYVDFRKQDLDPIQQLYWGITGQKKLHLSLKRRKLTAQLYPEALSPDIDLEMVLIPGGTFTMGSPDDEPERSDDESPQHEVTVPDFFMGKYQVTQEQWRIVAGYPKVTIELNPNPSNFTGDNLPVEQVSWDEAVEFCDRLRVKTGRSYQLPSESQWEYACRAGTDTPFAFGKILSADLANYDGNYTYNDGPKGEYRETTTAVGTFPANAFGLYDMHGNVWEWCADDWHENYEGAPTDGSVWNASNDFGSDPESDFNKVLRGGSWLHDPKRCRSAFRSNNASGSCDDGVGFRVVVIVPPRP